MTTETVASSHDRADATNAFTAAVPSAMGSFWVRGARGEDGCTSVATYRAQ
jgi:hypothetical protein